MGSPAGRYQPKMGSPVILYPWEGLDFLVDETPATTSSPSTSKRMATKRNEFLGWEVGAGSWWKGPDVKNQGLTD